MSQENVEIIKRVYDAYRRGDFEACLSYFDSGVEFSQPTEEPGAGTYHGHEGIIQAMTPRMYYDEGEALEAVGRRE